MTDDGSLLRQYVSERSEAAFAEIVHRHLDLVYSAARRNLRGDSHRAQDVVQRVFTDLARKAALLSDRRTIAGWLYISAHHAAVEMMRSEQRRELREREAQLMHESHGRLEDALDWNELEPILDDVVGELGEAERDVIVLRFFKQRSFAQIGAQLRLTEGTAQKRAERALDKMRSALAARGITSTGAALASLIEAQAVVAAPSGLGALVIDGSAMLAVTATNVGTFTLMSAKSLLTGIVAAMAIGGLAGTAWQYRENGQLRTELAEIRRAEIQDRQKKAANEEADRKRLEAEREVLRTRTVGSGEIPVMEKEPERPAAQPLLPAHKNSPRTTASTVRIAIDGGDPVALLDVMTIAPEGRAMAEEAFGRLSLERQKQYESADMLMAELLCVTTPGSPAVAQIISEELEGVKAPGFGAELKDDPGYRTLHNRYRDATGRMRDDYQVFQQTDDGWRWVVSKGLVLKRLVETKLMALPPAVPTETP